MEVTYEITRKIGVLTEHATGWSKELNLVSWNGNPEKFDIRDWNPEHTQMGRGINLSKDEFSKMMNLGRDWQ